MTANKDQIPYFIKIRGCINCDSSKELKRRTGKEYGFDHELMFKCLVLCENYGFSLVHPFYDPEEAVRLAKKDGSKKVIEATKEYCLWVKENFGKYYDRLGVSLDDIVSTL